MKKTLLLLVVGLLTTNLAFSQATSEINFGGIGTGLYLSYDIPVATSIAIAPLVRTDWDFNHLVLGVKADYYFDNLFGLPAAWDVYAGLNGGWRLWIDDNANNNNEDFDFGAQIGGRWFWSDRWGLNAEFGGGSSINGGLGVTMRL
ncbi:MAG: hypothetical protein ABFS05_02320 [Bacteroidota bacterium]